MKLTAKDLKHLQWAIAFLAIMSLIGGGALWSLRQMEANSEKAYGEAIAARNDIRARLARARDEQAELREKIGRFEAIMARGLVGPERRLDWVEAIARVKAARSMGKLDYDFSPQRPADAAMLPEGAMAGGFEVMASQMRLRTELLHEGELLAFLADIRNSVNALVQVRSCTMERISAADQSRSGTAQIKADCTLEWITLREGK